MKEWIKNIKEAIANKTFALHYLDQCEKTITDLIAEIEKLEKLVAMKNVAEDGIQSYIIWAKEKIEKLENDRDEWIRIAGNAIDTIKRLESIVSKAKILLPGVLEIAMLHPQSYKRAMLEDLRKAIEECEECG